MQETLAWASDVMQSPSTAVTQHRALRDAPRRSFDFDLIANAQDRRVAEMLLAGHAGAWLMPIWPDVQWLSATLDVGATSIPCATAGFDFVDGGKALLYTAVNRWEVVGIDSIAADSIALTTATLAAYGPGSRLYPLRRARVQDGAEERLRNDDVGLRRMVFDIDEACDWPELASPTLYLGHPVLDVRPDESDDPASSNARLVQVVDYGTSLPVAHDLAGVALRAQQSHWRLYGRAEHTWFRSLLYTLRARHAPIWVPSWASDLRVVSPIAGDSTSLSIEWAGYTLFGKGKPNRKDIRVELFDGSVLYRRIVDASEAGTTETLTLDSALDASSTAVDSIRSVSFMALCTLASDEVEIEHVTDAEGLANSTTGWQAVVPDV